MRASGFLLFFIALFSFVDAFSQKAIGKISGTIYSDSSNKPIISASVSLVNSKDSTVEKMTVSDKNGHFNFIDLRLNEYNLLVTLINYRPYSKAITLTEHKSEVIIDSIVVNFTSDSLASVTVVGYKAPVVYKTDTTEFNASSFKVKDNALVEDVLKKLPGVEILKDGTVQAQGEKITQIYVDGKPFFGNDPKMITQNLPANIIDKIQLVDKKSEQAQTTKVEDGVREKIINITIKKDKNRGYFGRTYVGYGTSGRYEGKVSANYFNKASKVSLVAGGNNTGRNDYGSGEDESSSYNNYNGISKDFQAKLSYTDKWNKNLDVNANVGYSDNTNETRQVRNRQNICGDSSNYYFEQNEAIRTRSGINTGFGFEYRPDTFTNIRMNQTANFGTSIYNSTSIFNSSLLNSKKINEGNRRNNNSSNSPFFSGNLTVSRRFRKEGRGMFFNFNNNINSNFSEGFNVSNNNFFPVNAVEYQLLQNQFINNDSRSTSVNSSISYGEPISKKSSVNVSASYNYSNSNSLRETFDFNTASSFYDLFNDSLSNNFKNFNYNSSFGANYSYHLKNFFASAGTTWQDSKTESRQLNKDTVYIQHYAGFVPYLNANYYNKGTRLGLSYNFSNRAPQAYQLQPIIDNSNPLYIRYGNPNLKYATTHRVNLNFNRYNSKKQSSLYSSASVSYTANNISTSSVLDKQTGQQTSQPINVNGVYGGNGNIGYSVPFKFWKNKLSWNTNTNFNVGRNISLINLEKNISRTYGARVSTGFEFEIEDFLEIEFRPSVNIQSTSFSLKPNLNNTYYTYGCDYGFDVVLGELTEITLNGDFSKNTGRTAGFNRNINMINVDVTQYLNSKKSWWLKLKVYDLLKQNLSVYRFSGESFIEDTQSNVLTRFFLLSVNYKLTKFKGKS